MELFVTHVSHLSQDQFRDVFERIGPLISCRLKKTYGFILYKSNADADTAVRKLFFIFLFCCFIIFRLEGEVVYGGKIHVRVLLFLLIINVCAYL
jgi:hypothetical protein